MAPAAMHSAVMHAIKMGSPFDIRGGQTHSHAYVAVMHVQAHVCMELAVEVDLDLQGEADAS